MNYSHSYMQFIDTLFESHQKSYSVDNLNKNVCVSYEWIVFSINWHQSIDTLVEIAAEVVNLYSVDMRKKNVRMFASLMSVFFLSINWHQLTIHHLVNELFIYCLTDKVGGLFISEEIPSEMEIAPRYTLLTLFVLFLLIKLMYTA